MTDKERQKLCAWLRDHYRDDPMCWKAANEIEQLAEQVEWLRTAQRAANIALAHADPNRKYNYSYDDNG